MREERDGADGEFLEDVGGDGWASIGGGDSGFGEDGDIAALHPFAHIGVAGIGGIGARDEVKGVAAGGDIGGGAADDFHCAGSDVAAFPEGHRGSFERITSGGAYVNHAARGVLLADLRDAIFRSGLSGVARFEAEGVAVVEASLGQGEPQDAGNECAKDRGQQNDREQG